jgi:thiol-disulfide isomerase/thioredoxin
MTKLKTFLPGLIIVLGVLYGAGAFSVHAAPSMGAMPKPLVAEKAAKTAPDLGFSDVKGRHSLKDFRGKYVLVNMWATWCAPCVAELPALARLKATVPGLTVLAVDLTGKAETPAKAAAFMKERNAASLGSYVDTERSFMRTFQAAVMPTTVLLDPNGKVVARAEGPGEWASPAFVSYFQSLR